MDQTRWATALVHAVVPQAVLDAGGAKEPAKPTAGILDLPLELIDAIAEEIEDLATLISLSSTCHFLRLPLYTGHIKPSHLAFSTDHGWILSDIAQNPLAVSRVRHLILEPSDERKCLERMGGTADTGGVDALRREVACERALVDVVKLMRSLRTLEFRDASPWLRDELWDAVWSACPRLRELDVAGHFYTTDAPPAMRPDEVGQPDVERDEAGMVKRLRPPLFGSSLSKVRNLHRFTFFAFHLRPRLDLDAIAWRRLEGPLISDNPHLRELRLGKTTRTQVSSLLEKGKWPELKLLSLINCEATCESVLSFMTSHPGIEVLQLQCVPPRLMEPVPLEGLPSSALPNLRHFAGSTVNAASLLTSPRESLECVAGLMLPLVRQGPNGREDDEAASLCLRNAPNLHELHIEVDWAEATRSTLLRLFSTFARVERLSIKTDSTSLENWLPAFSLVPCLRALTFPLHQMHAPLSSIPEPGSHALRFGGRGHTPSSFVGRIGDRVKLVATKAEGLEIVDFGTGGAAQTGRARVVRYKGSVEVDEVRMEGSSTPFTPSDSSDVEHRDRGNGREKRKEDGTKAFFCAFRDERAERTMRAALCDPEGYG